MNTQDNKTSNDTRTDSSTSIRSDAVSNDASSGKSSSGREPQQGTGIDNRSNLGKGADGGSSTDGHRKS